MLKVASKGFGIVFITVIVEKMISNSIIPFLLQTLDFILNTYKTLIGVVIFILATYIALVIGVKKQAKELARNK